MSLNDSSVANIEGAFPPFGIGGIRSATGISLIDSRIENVGTSEDAGIQDLAFALSAPTVSMLRSTVDSVQAGIFSVAVRGDDLSIVESTISNVTGGGSEDNGQGDLIPTGYGSAAKGGSVVVVNSTIAENAVDLSAIGPVGLVDGDSVSIRNSTIANNEVGDQAYAIRGTDVSLVNSVLSNNGVDGQDDVAPGTTITSNGHNVFGQLAVAGAEPGDVLGASSGALFPTGALADNGGPTADRCAARRPEQSGAEHGRSGGCAATDQRGFLRDATPDIGSFELEACRLAMELVVTTLDDVVDATDGQVSLREAIAFANSPAGADTITFADGDPRRDDRRIDSAA